MSIAGNLVINLMGNTQHLNRALTRSASRIRAFSANSQRSLTAFGTTSAATFAAIGAGATRARTALGNVALAMSGGVAIGTGLAFKNLVKFDDAIRAAAARARTGAAGIEILRNRAKELGRTSSFTQTQVAEMMEGLTKGGFSVPQVVGGMTKAVMDLSRAAGTDGAMAARLLGDSIGVFNLKAADSNKVASVLAGVLNRTRMDVDDLSDGFKFAAKTGADLGMSLSDTIAIMGTLAQAGLRGSLAGTAIRKIGQITVSEAGKIRKEFGVAFKETENGTVNVIENFGILSAALQDLTRTDRLSKFFEAFGIRGAQAASSLADQAVNTRKLADELRQVSENGTEAAETAKKMDAGIGGSLRRLKSAAEALGDTWAGALVDPVIEGLDAIREETTDFANWLETQGIPGMQAGMEQTSIAGYSLVDGLTEFGPELAKGFFKYWESRAAEFLGSPVLSPEQISGIDEAFGYSRGIEDAQRETDAFFKFIDDIYKVKPLKEFFNWIGGMMPRLPTPGGPHQGIRPGDLGELTGRAYSPAEQDDIARRFEKFDDRMKKRPVRADPFRDPPESEVQRSKNQRTWQKFMDFMSGRYNQMINAVAQDKVIPMTDKFPELNVQEKKAEAAANAEAAVRAAQAQGSPGRSGRVFGLQDVIRDMERQGASKQDINRMISAQERLRKAMDKAARIKEKTIRVEIAEPE